MDFLLFGLFRKEREREIVLPFSAKPLESWVEKGRLLLAFERPPTLFRKLRFISLSPPPLHGP